MLLTLLCSQSFPASTLTSSLHSFIDPTGTYILKGTLKGNRITGHFGEIRVKLLTGSKIALCFYINSGSPNYESGSFMDTLAYLDNLAKYHPDRAPECSILFCFSINKAEIQQLFTDPHSNCGFGIGVMASALFQKYSGEIPIIQDLSTHGIVPRSGSQ